LGVFEKGPNNSGKKSRKRRLSFFVHSNNNGEFTSKAFGERHPTTFYIPI
jgi:hypothetical protein